MIIAIHEDDGVSVEVLRTKSKARSPLPKVPSFRSAWGSGYCTAGSRRPISIAMIAITTRDRIGFILNIYFAPLTTNSDHAVLRIRI